VDEIAEIELDMTFIFTPVIRIKDKDGVVIKEIKPKQTEAQAVFSTMLIAWDKYKKENHGAI